MIEKWCKCDIANLTPDKWLSLITLAGYNNISHTKEILKDMLTIPTFETMLAQMQNLTNSEATSESILGWRINSMIEMNRLDSAATCWRYTLFL